MSGKSPVSASEDQRSALAALAGSRDRGEADRSRAVLLTLAGLTESRTRGVQRGRTRTECRAANTQVAMEFLNASVSAGVGKK